VLRKKETTHAKEEKEKNIRKKNVPRASLEGRFLFSLARNCTVTVMPDLYASRLSTYRSCSFGGFRCGHVGQILDDFFRVFGFAGAGFAGAKDRLVLSF
jgi:hypothetical protein